MKNSLRKFIVWLIALCPRKLMKLNDEDTDVWLCQYLPIRFGLRRYWHELWIREDEFHPSLRLDPDIRLSLEYRDLKERHAYEVQCLARRQKAHDRDIAHWEDVIHSTSR
jgi:hypothetical protein